MMDMLRKMLHTETNCDILTACTKKFMREA